MNKETEIPKIDFEDVINRHACEIDDIKGIIALQNNKIYELEKATKLNRLAGEKLLNLIDNIYSLNNRNIDALKKDINWGFLNILVLYAIAITLSSVVLAITH